jgi:hypothetical protein
VFDAKGATDLALRVEHFGKGLTLDIDADKQALSAAPSPPSRSRSASRAPRLWKIRKKQFAKMGGLSTDYIYAYYEDAALGLDALAEGVRVTIDTSARWIHMEGVGKSMPPHVRSFMWLNRCPLLNAQYAGTPHVVDTLMDQSLAMTSPSKLKLSHCRALSPPRDEGRRAICREGSARHGSDAGDDFEAVLLAGIDGRMFPQYVKVGSVITALPETRERVYPRRLQVRRFLPCRPRSAPQQDARPLSGGPPAGRDPYPPLAVGRAGVHRAVQARCCPNAEDHLHSA